MNSLLCESTQQGIQRSCSDRHTERERKASCRRQALGDQRGPAAHIDEPQRPAYPADDAAACSISDEAVTEELAPCVRVSRDRKSEQITVKARRRAVHLVCSCTVGREDGGREGAVGAQELAADLLAYPAILLGEQSHLRGASDRSHSRHKKRCKFQQQHSAMRFECARLVGRELAQCSSSSLKTSERLRNPNW